MNLISNPISPRVLNETKEQTGSALNNFAKGSGVLVAGTVGTALTAGTLKTAQLISDTVHSAGKELTATTFLTKTKNAITTMWKELPNKSSKTIVLATALGLAAVAVKSLVDAVKIHKSNNEIS